MKTRHFNFSAVVRAATDVAGEWVVHVLDLDLVTQGRSIPHAFEMAGEASAMVLIDDLGAGKDPLARRASQDAWDAFWAMAREGTPVRPADVDSRDRSIVVLGQLHIELRTSDERPAPRSVRRADVPFAVTSRMVEAQV